MKKSRILVLAVALISMSFSRPIIVTQKSLKVDVVHSTISWKGYKPTGSHSGTVNLSSGILEVEGGKIKGGSFTVDMATIKDTDGSGKLEGHLKSEDFFDVESHTSSKFEITGIENKEGKILVTGNMTIKSIAKQITFPATLAETNEAVTLISDTFQINRTDFNVKYKSKSFFNDLKEKFINDEFDLQVTIVANK